MKTMPVLSVNQEERTEHLMFEAHSDAKSSRLKTWKGVALTQKRNLTSLLKAINIIRRRVASHLYLRESISLGMACFSLVHMLFPGGFHCWIPNFFRRDSIAIFLAGSVHHGTIPPILRNTSGLNTINFVASTTMFIGSLSHPHALFIRILSGYSIAIIIIIIPYYPMVFL